MDAAMMNDRRALAGRVVPLIDLTSLNEDDTPERIVSLCGQVQTGQMYVAALCIYSRFIGLVRKQLSHEHADAVRIATVCNFPDGVHEMAAVVAETQTAVMRGADEVDVVFPYRALMAGDAVAGQRLVRACKQACGDRTLKVILETGVLQSPALIRQASEIAIQAGADFIKTSTGKVAVNATAAAAEIMLQVIAEQGGQCGFKAAGGIRTLEDAAVYLALADRIMGSFWVTPSHFRFGASGLLADVSAALAGTHHTPSSSY